MLIAIEAQRIFRSHKHGMDVVALELCRELQMADHVNDYVLLANTGGDRSCISSSGNFSVQLIRGITYAGWEQFSLPRALKRLKADFVHCTANTAPFFSPVPVVLTLHDIIYLEESSFKGSAYQNFGNLYRRAVVPTAIRNSRAIITVSEFEKQVILARYPSAADKITVIYNAVGERFNRSYETVNFRRKYQLPENFILLLGNTAPKKNTRGALKAYQHYRSVASDPLPLVVVDYEPSEGNSHIIYPGYIPSDEMPLLYNSASLFLYPSLRESFGLPLLEAMACGLPVIASNVSAIPEIAGAAALLVDPLNHVAMGDMINQLLNDPALTESCIQKGLARASQFSWKKSAQQLLQLYSGI